MKDPVIEPPTGRANKAVLDFAKSTDDFATADQVKSAEDKVQDVLKKDLGVSDLKLDPVEGTLDFLTLRESAARLGQEDRGCEGALDKAQRP